MKILILCTYPVKKPKHGGQLRVRNIADAYLAAGHHVEVSGVLGSDSYEREAGFVDFPDARDLAAVMPNITLMEDYAIGVLFADDNNHFEKLAALIRIKPEVIHVEQPWLFAFARRFAQEYVPNAKVIYGSQNVEWRLKQEILLSYFDTTIAQQNAELIKLVELSALVEADAIIAVSEGDAEWLKSQSNRNIVVAPNGVRVWQTNESGQEEAAVITKGFRYCLYCASAHPPNVTGFFEVLGGGFGSLKPDEKLVIVGGAGHAIADDLRVHQSAKLAEKVLVAGMVEQHCLEALLDAAHAVVLPLTQGGGTNLKTAEALWSGKHVVATSVAMRGFEEFIGTRGLHVADEPSAFKRVLRIAMETESLKLSPNEIDARRSVLWEHCLQPLVLLISNLTANTQK